MRHLRHTGFIEPLPLYCLSVFGIVIGSLVGWPTEPHYKKAAELRSVINSAHVERALAGWGDEDGWPLFIDKPYKFNRSLCVEAKDRLKEFIEESGIYWVDPSVDPEEWFSDEDHTDFLRLWTTNAPMKTNILEVCGLDTNFWNVTPWRSVNTDSNGWAGFELIYEKLVWTKEIPVLGVCTQYITSYSYVSGDVDSSAYESAEEVSSSALPWAGDGNGCDDLAETVQYDDCFDGETTTWSYARADCPTGTESTETVSDLGVHIERYCLFTSGEKSSSYTFDWEDRVYRDSCETDYAYSEASGFATWEYTYFDDVYYVKTDYYSSGTFELSGLTTQIASEVVFFGDIVIDVDTYDVEFSGNYNALPEEGFNLDQSGNTLSCGKNAACEETSTNNLVLSFSVVATNTFASWTGNRWAPLGSSMKGASEDAATLSVNTSKPDSAGYYIDGDSELNATEEFTCEFTDSYPHDSGHIEVIDNFYSSHSMTYGIDYIEAHLCEWSASAYSALVKWGFQYGPE